MLMNLSELIYLPHLNPPRKRGPKKPMRTKTDKISNSLKAKGVEKPRSTGKQYSFFENVYEVVRQVPKGRVTTYGAIANYLGTKLSSRMVGWAMKAAHDLHSPVPAQLVLNRNGMLTGRLHYATPTRMQELLEKDGVKVKNNTVV